MCVCMHDTCWFIQEYGGWESCPHVITANVLEMEQFSMTEVLLSYALQWIM